MEDGRAIYFAGDTALFGDMRLISEIYAPEIAFLPIGDHYTMDPAAAAKACELLGVRQVVPMHYGTFPALTGSPDDLKTLVEPRGVDVLVLKPGETASSDAAAASRAHCTWRRAQALPLLTLGRIPTPSADAPALRLDRARPGARRRSASRRFSGDSPEAVDHVPFYGPVFFDLASTAFKGLRCVARRVPSRERRLGAAVYPDRDRSPRSTPDGLAGSHAGCDRDRDADGEVNFAATTGAMHMLARPGSRSRRHGGIREGRRLATGVCLLLGALTTPRAYPFIVAFACAAAGDLRRLRHDATGRPRHSAQRRH